MMGQLVYDRAASDIARWRYLRDKGYANMTEAERAEWVSPLKGVYNHTDMTRVETAVAYVAGRLKELGYIVVFPTVRTWAVGEIPNEVEITRYFSNVAMLRQSVAVWASTPEAPTSVVGFGVNEANALEKILADIDAILDLISQAWFYSGDLYAAEV